MAFSIASMTGHAPFRKIKSAAVSGVSEARSLAIVRPAIENRRSEGAEVAGTHSVLRANADKIDSHAGIVALDHSAESHVFYRRERLISFHDPLQRLFLLIRFAASRKSSRNK